MIHDINLILALLNSKIKSVYANGVSVLSKSSDLVSARLEFENGCIANLTASRLSVKPLRKLRVFEKNTYSSLDLQKSSIEKYIVSSKANSNQDVVFEFKNNSVKKESILIEKQNALYEELVSFSESIQNQQSIEVDGNDAIKTLEIALLIQQKINALTIDLRNYGQSDTVSKYENLGLRSYNDVLGAFDFLKTIGFNSDQIGLHGISLGGSTAIFAAANEPTIKAIWTDSTLAEFNLILKDEIARYGMPNIFGPAVSFIGQRLTGIDPSDLSPAYKLTSSQSYYITHGQKDKRVPAHHFEFFQNYINNNNVDAEFWLIPDASHVDAMIKYPNEYS